METIRGELDRKEKEANAQKLKDAIRNQGIDAEDAILENE
jgi:hypothetical protein